MTEVQPVEDRVQSVLSLTIWGSRPWRRFLIVAGAWTSAMLVERTMAVTRFSQREAWVLLVTLDAGDWLHVLLGSVFAWLPWSLTLIAGTAAVFAVQAAISPLYAAGMQEVAEGDEVMVSTYRDLASLVLIPWAPVVVLVFVIQGQPPLQQCLVAAGGLVGWLFAAAGVTDEYRHALLAHVESLRRARRATIGHLWRARAARCQLRTPPKLRRFATSWLILILLICVIAGTVGGLRSDTPWVPMSCLRDGSSAGPKTNVFVMGERPEGVVVLRDEDRRVEIVADPELTLGQC